MVSRDRLSPEKRSSLMRAIRRADTRPELLLRRYLWARGARYRLEQRVQKARPDLFFKSSRVAVFVDGCFWHGCPIHYRPPAGNASYWRGKIERNRARDERNTRDLEAAGYAVLRFWECDVKAHPEGAADQVLSAVKNSGKHRGPSPASAGGGVRVHGRDV
jgi:DNA mismatch endonuclease (patch repair protein)